MGAVPRPLGGFVPMDHLEFQIDEKNPALFIRLIWFPLEAFYSLSLYLFLDGILAARFGDDIRVTDDVDENGRLLAQRLGKGVFEVGAIGHPVAHGAKGACDQVEGGIADPSLWPALKKPKSLVNFLKLAFVYWAT